MRSTNYADLYNSTLKRAIQRGASLEVAQCIAKAVVQEQRGMDAVGALTTCVWDNAS